MGIYMAGRSIARLVCRRFSTGSKVAPKSDTVAEKFPTKKRDHAWEAFEQRRPDLHRPFGKDGRVIDFGLKFICVFSFVMALMRSAEIREAEAKALGEKTPDDVAAEKRQEAEAIGERKALLLFHRYVEMHLALQT